MSSASRASIISASGMPLSRANCSPLSISPLSAPSICWQAGTKASYSDSDIIKLPGSAHELSDPWSAERQRRRGPAHPARQLRLIGAAAMLDAIGEARVHLHTAEMEV